MPAQPGARRPACARGRSGPACARAPPRASSVHAHAALRLVPARPAARSTPRPAAPRGPWRPAARCGPRPLALVSAVRPPPAGARPGPHAPSPLGGGVSALPPKGGHPTGSLAPSAFSECGHGRGLVASLSILLFGVQRPSRPRGGHPLAKGEGRGRASVGRWEPVGSPAPPALLLLVLYPSAVTVAALSHSAQGE